MDLDKLVSQAKDAVEKRGGTDALKGDAEELKDIATGDGSLTDKAKAAAEALKEPGAQTRKRVKFRKTARLDPSQIDDRRGRVAVWGAARWPFGGGGIGLIVRGGRAAARSSIRSRAERAAWAG